MWGRATGLLRAGLVKHTMQTNPAVEQIKNIKWSRNIKFSTKNIKWFRNIKWSNLVSSLRNF